MLEINKEIKNFLGTTEGRKFFRNITPELSGSARHEFKKSLLCAPKKIRRRSLVLDSIKNEININKKLDKA